MTLPELGVGLTWFSGLEPALESNAGSIDVLEIEPQTFWRRAPDGQSIVVDAATLEALRACPIPKLVHGVGFPVGGTRPPMPEELELLREMALKLNAPWLSEHLSFNRVTMESGVHFTSFLLPPRQTVAGVDVAVRSIRKMSSRMPVPMAIETGVSYLRPRIDELPDGEFVARVVEAADCGIVLDLHNIWTNQRNGRQNIEDFLGQIPLDRVWEIHLAGGSDHRGYWLDAHSGGVPQELFEIASGIVQRLPNLKALIFELFSAYLPSVGYGIFRTQLEQLHRLWEMRRSGFPVRIRNKVEMSLEDLPPSPQEWEDTLGTLVVGGVRATALATELLEDPGVGIIRDLVEQFRASMIVRTLRFSSRLIMLERGTDYFEQLLTHYWNGHPPQPFGFDEAEGFATFLRDLDPQIPCLYEMLDYDRGVMAVALDGEERLIPFGVDPLPLLRALGAGRKPEITIAGRFEVLLTPDPAGPGLSTASERQVIH